MIPLPQKLKVETNQHPRNIFTKNCASAPHERRAKKESSSRRRHPIKRFDVMTHNISNHLRTLNDHKK